MADMYLPVWVRDLPADLIFDRSRLKPKIEHYVREGIVRVIAGAERCHVSIDIQRPYHRPPLQLNAPALDGDLK